MHNKPLLVLSWNQSPKSTVSMDWICNEGTQLSGWFNGCRNHINPPEPWSVQSTSLAWIHKNLRQFAATGKLRPKLKQLLVHYSRSSYQIQARVSLGRDFLIELRIPCLRQGVRSRSDHSLSQKTPDDPQMTLSNHPHQPDDSQMTPRWNLKATLSLSWFSDDPQTTLSHKGNPKIP